MTRKKKIRELEVNLERTFPMLPQKDANGQFIAYCTYRHHPGVIIPERRNKCKRDCKYLVLYWEEEMK